jgi:hypothetical protein
MFGVSREYAISSLTGFGRGAVRARRAHHLAAARLVMAMNAIVSGTRHDTNFR